MGEAKAGGKSGGGTGQRYNGGGCDGDQGLRRHEAGFDEHIKAPAKDFGTGCRLVCIDGLRP
jgi:hypothetical protein